MPIDINELRVVKDALRAYINSAGYGHFVSDDKILEISTVIMQALEDYHSGTVI